MTKAKAYKLPEEIEKGIVADRGSSYGLRTYVSLFSSAGVGCYGFKEEGFYCVATVELLEKRLKIQSYNDKCVYKSGYICGDMTMQETKDRVFAELDMWKTNFHVTDLDVLIATPPCQGMSVANHKKKKDEIVRNSLVVESIKMVHDIRPKFFVFENVRAFLTSVCTDIDGNTKSIGDAIETNLGGLYNILYKVVNFKDYGNPSSRTRTLVIGVRKDIKEITPYDVFPDKQPEKTLRQVIGHLPSLKRMGEISDSDIYHNFGKYNPKMEAWISEIKEGQSAFDNTDPNRIPHTVKGVVVYNVQKNGDKYTRQYWDKVAPCIHTRNDIMASQNTVHPVDNRVFSIREVMLMMSVPETFSWSNIPFEELNALPQKEKEGYLKKEEMNIRQTLGEAVPTIIFRKIAHKIRKALCRVNLSEQDVKGLIERRKLKDTDRLLSFIKGNTTYKFSELSKVAELANAQRADNAAYYTRQDTCFSIVSKLPEAKEYATLNILEPSVGVGNFLPTLVKKYADVPVVNIDVVDIDANSISILQALVEKIDVPDNVHINYIIADSLLYDFDKKYDIVIGNPPYMKIKKEKNLLSLYKKHAVNKDTNNIFAFFIERMMEVGNVVSLIVPKSLINAPEFNATRELMKEKSLTHIIDFGEKGFKGVKIETISFILDTRRMPCLTQVESYVTGDVRCCLQEYIMDDRFPYWLIYRDSCFDKVASEMNFNVFKAYRDRTITKSKTKSKGRVRVLKSRNIGDNKIVDITDYDSYIDDLDGLDVAKFLNQNCVLLPNPTYNPRACFMPSNCITDGSVAILTPLDPSVVITKDDLAFYATEEFSKFYSVARNRGTRSLNIDNNSVFFFWDIKTTWYMKREDIQEHLDSYNDYDIRKNHNCRFVDHKCTPDVVCFIADCILNTDCATKSFTVSDLWKTQFFIKNTRIVFHKPYADDDKAHNEYNKVLSQPLKLLAYAHVLEVDDAQRLLVFRINNMELLEYIASRERNAFNFLEVFFRKVVSESGIWRFFEEYKENCKDAAVGEIRAAKNILYDKYHRFISANTPTQSKLDTDRMLHKVLNVFAYAEMIPGSNGKIPDWGDFMYNRVNWRDEGKDKTLTRSEAAAKEKDDINANFYVEYQVDKAIKNVKRKQGDVSEVRDELATGIATEVHHIFPKSQFPMISSYYENLILLTSSQHRQKAHPKGNTQVIDKDYQLTCLMSKAQTIERSLNDGENFYRRESFVYVINTGLTEHLSETTSFTDIRKFLVKKYLEF